MIRREWVMSHESWVRWGMLCRNFFWNDKPRVWLIWYPANLRYASVLAWVGCRCSSIQCGLCASVSSKKKSVNIIWASDSVRTCDMWHVTCVRCEVRWWEAATGIRQHNADVVCAGRWCILPNYDSTLELVMASIEELDIVPCCSLVWCFFGEDWNATVKKAVTSDIWHLTCLGRVSSDHRPWP